MPSDHGPGERVQPHRHVLLPARGPWGRAWIYHVTCDDATGKVGRIGEPSGMLFKLQLED